MKRAAYVLCLLMFFSVSLQAKDKPVKIETTFLVVMDKNAETKITDALKKEAGIKKYEIDASKQTVIVAFQSDKNTVSNLLKVIRNLGYTALAQETGCFGSKEGCINAMHPENTMP